MENATPIQIFLVVLVDAIAIGIIAFFTVKYWLVKGRKKGVSYEKHA